MTSKAVTIPVCTKVSIPVETADIVWTEADSVVGTVDVADGLTSRGLTGKKCAVQLSRPPAHQTHQGEILSKASTVRPCVCQGGQWWHGSLHVRQKTAVEINAVHAEEELKKTVKRGHTSTSGERSACYRRTDSSKADGETTCTDEKAASTASSLASQVPGQVLQQVVTARHVQVRSV